jgi:hypothetical protein
MQFRQYGNHASDKFIARRKSISRNRLFTNSKINGTVGGAAQARFEHLIGIYVYKFGACIFFIAEQNLR